MICIFSHWVEAFPCWHATALTVAKLLLEKIIPVWGIPLKLHGDLETDFTGHTMKQICSIWPILQHFHYAYHPQSCGLVERTNGSIKTKSAKFMETFKLTWPTAFSLVLLNLRATPFRKHKLSRCKSVTGRTLHLALLTFSAQLIKEDILYFFKGLIKVMHKNQAIFSVCSQEAKK